MQVLTSKDAKAALEKVVSKLGSGVMTTPLEVKGRTDSFVIGWLTDEEKGLDAIFLVWKDYLGMIRVKRLALFEGPVLKQIAKAEQVGESILVEFHPKVGSLVYPLSEMEVKTPIN